MKRILLLAALGMLSPGAQAQPWIDNSSGKPQKLQDLIDRYESNLKSGYRTEAEQGEGKQVREGKNHHFSRWVWHWQQQLDEDGYMVSPVRKWKEWEAWQQRRSAVQYKTTNESDWTFQGPDNSPGGYAGIGRINVVAFHPTDINTFIIGSAGGGAWRTEDGGLSWNALYNNLPVLGVSDVDYNPLNPNVIYLCTGDRDASDTYSVGVMKSTDGGATWNLTGLQFNVTDFELTNALLINPQDTSSLLVATSDGIYKSFDAGDTWVKVRNGDYKEILYHPTDTNIVYTCTYNGSPYSHIFKSRDGGLTWEQVSNISGARRISLAVTPADPNIVKAVVSNANHGLLGVYSSNDTGNNFYRVYGNPTVCETNILSGNMVLNGSSCSGQGWYDLCIAISPLDPNQVLVGGVNTWQSLDGGESWQIVNQWTSGAPGVKVVHADKHYFAYNPLDQAVLYECNDGGIYKTADPASMLWNDLSNGLGITQFYRNAVAGNANFVLGGAQDNGSKRIRFTGTYNELTGGDGMDCHIDYTDSSVFYTSVQYGSLRRTLNNGGNFTTISNNIPGNPEGEWITPFVIHPLYPTMLIAGYDHVYLSTDRGNSWTDISPTFPTSGNKIRRVAMSPAHPDRIFVLSGTLTIRYTDDYGANWNNVLLTPSGRVSDIQIDPKDPDRLWVTYSGYTANKVAEYVIGSGWTIRNDSLPNVPVHCMAIDSSNGTLYVGTDIGVFYRDTTMSQWEPYNNGLPVIEVADLGINYTTNEIWAATYGRGMWKSPRHTFQSQGIQQIPYAADVISVVPNPNNGTFTVSTTNEALANKSVSVRIISYTGTVAQQLEGRFSGGRLEISNGGLARGSYIVEVSKDRQVFARARMLVL